MSEDIYDVIIVGGGPAGLTAGLYSARAGLKCLVIEKALYGGQISNAELVENYPGFPEGITGFELGEKMYQQANRYGLESLFAEVTGLSVSGKVKVIETNEGSYTGKVVILAGGTVRRKLEVEGESKFMGKGVSYCAVCDGAFFRDRKIVVVGGGDTAITEALHLTHFAESVTIIHRRNELRAAHVLQKKVKSDPKINILWDSVVTGIKGNAFVESIEVKNVKTGEISENPADGIFISVGTIPDTKYLHDILPLDESGYILANENMETEIPGIFAAGDIRHNSARQAVIAAGDGATAALYAQKYLIEYV